MDRNPEETVKRNHKLVADCAPSAVFSIFADISAVPRGSGNMRGMGDFLVDFAEKHRLEYVRDALSNIIIRKPAQRSSARAGVILQAHQDMVCVKDEASSHDFLRDPIEFARPESGVLTANMTTLGADNGLGMAMALAILADRGIAHPPLEGLFTVDEETDMKGAKAITPDMLTGTHLINLDSEELGQAYVSSAAGSSWLIEIPVCRVDAGGGDVREIVVDKLSGGHSGAQINVGFANAFVLLSRVLADAAAEIDYGLISCDMGADKGADNAIPAKAVARVILADADASARLDELLAKWRETLRREYRTSDPALELVSRPAPTGVAVPPPLTAESRDAFLRVIRLMPLGVFRFIQDERRMEDMLYRDMLVETSCNLGVVRLDADAARMKPLARGSVASVLDDLTARMADLVAMAGGTCTMINRTAGWEMASPKPKVQRLFEESVVLPWRLVGVHAGLECGCFVESFAQAGRELHAVSVGPTIENPHSPYELLEIATVRPMWDSLLEVLANLAK